MYYVYIVASVSRTLYIGVTNDLRRRVYEHKTSAIPGFTARYKVNRLVYFEPSETPEAAIAREKQLKGWVRRRKVALIEAGEPRVGRSLGQDRFAPDGHARCVSGTARRVAGLDYGAKNEVAAIRSFGRAQAVVLLRVLGGAPSG